jgi:hypothetical protein
MSTDLDPVMLLRGEKVSCPTIGCFKDWVSPYDYTAKMLEIIDGVMMCHKCKTWYPWSAFWGEDAPW